jgi:hypothetical protein
MNRRFDPAQGRPRPRPGSSDPHRNARSRRARHRRCARVRAERSDASGRIDAFDLFCAYHLGITPDGGYRIQNIHEVARRFGTNAASCARSSPTRHGADDIVHSGFDLPSAQVDIMVAPEGISRRELARPLYDEFRSTPEADARLEARDGRRATPDRERRSDAMGAGRRRRATRAASNREPGPRSLQRRRQVGDRDRRRHRIGAAIARVFASAAPKVLIASRNGEHLGPVAKALRDDGGTVESITCDVRDADQVETMFDRAESPSAASTCMINNHGASFYARAEELSPNGFATIVAINLNGTFLCARAAARAWIERSKAGRIINMSSEAGTYGAPGMAHYAAAKAACRT